MRTWTVAVTLFGSSVDYSNRERWDSTVYTGQISVAEYPPSTAAPLYQPPRSDGAWLCFIVIFSCRAIVPGFTFPLFFYFAGGRVGGGSGTSFMGCLSSENMFDLVFVALCRSYEGFFVVYLVCVSQPLLCRVVPEKGRRGRPGSE